MRTMAYSPWRSQAALLLLFFTACLTLNVQAGQLPADLSRPEAVCELRGSLAAKGQEADPIIDELFAKELEACPPNVEQLSALQYRTRTGADFYRAAQEQESECSFLLEVLSDRMLQPVAYTVESGVENGYVSKKDPALVGIVEQLRACKINPDLPPSTTEKIMLNAKAGNWDYLWSRFRDRYLKKTAFAALLGISLLFNLISLSKALKRKKASASPTS